MSTYPSRIEEGRTALVYGMGCTSQERKNPFSPLYSRKNGWKKICLSIQNHGFKSIFIALLEMALSCWYFGALLKGQTVTGVSKITRIINSCALFFCNCCVFGDSDPYTVKSPQNLDMNLSITF